MPALGGVSALGGLLWGVPALVGACSRGVPALGVCVETPMMATAAGSTHPTGMHSCYYIAKWYVYMPGRYVDIPPWI